jgi:IS30 family transposase
MPFRKDYFTGLRLDRGKENAEHVLFTKNAKMKVPFAHPQSP